VIGRSRRALRAPAAVLAAVLVVVAGCGSTAPTLEPSNPVVTMAPTQSPFPSLTATVGSPAATPSGPVAPIVVDPWSEAAVLASLLQSGDVPRDLSPDDVRIVATDETPGWVEHAGLRVVKRNWSGRGPVSSVFDLRYQFPSAAAAQGFLEDARSALSEEGAGLQYVEGKPLGDLSFRYAGTISFGGIQTNNYNYLVRVQNIVAKVFVGGGSELDLSIADAIAARVPERMRAALKGGIVASPSASTGFPNEAEAAILQHIPENLHMGCTSVEEIYPTEIETVRCKPFNGPSIDYTAFSNTLDMTEAYQGDVDSADPAPSENGQCALGNYEWTYTVNGTPAGRIMCTSYLSARTNQTFRVIEWTNEELKILAYASSPTLGWGEMVDFWRGSAGPVP
jgi:hypothetical protein